MIKWVCGPKIFNICDPFFGGFFRRKRAVYNKVLFTECRIGRAKNDDILSRHKTFL